ncbi:hypothetical protein SESBI_26367 [Sesbania bispinosa]|nr:hypothetical protein SESBI_26367 [Sesbania bispinosa]
MATEEKENPYEGGTAGAGLGTGGKFRKRPFRRTQTTPYDRPPTSLRNPNRNNNGWFSKLVDPAHRLITHSAHSLFSSLFRKRLPPPPPHSSGVCWSAMKTSRTVERMQWPRDQASSGAEEIEMAFSRVGGAVAVLSRQVVLLIGRRYRFLARLCGGRLMQADGDSPSLRQHIGGER